MQHNSGIGIDVLLLLSPAAQGNLLTFAVYSSIASPYFLLLIPLTFQSLKNPTAVKNSSTPFFLFAALSPHFTVYRWITSLDSP